MKKLLLLACFLFAVFATKAQGPTLTLSQLLYLNGQSFLKTDSYLVARGWKYVGKESTDSMSTLTWAYGVRNSPLALVDLILVRQQVPITRYGTTERTSFTGIQSRVAAAAMLPVAQNLAGEQVGTCYRGKSYDVWLAIYKQRTALRPWYAAQIQRHGLIEGFCLGSDGKQEKVWLRPTEDGKGATVVTGTSLNADGTPKQCFFPEEALPAPSAEEAARRDSVLADFERSTRPIKTHKNP